MERATPDCLVPPVQSSMVSHARLHHSGSSWLSHPRRSLRAFDLTLAFGRERTGLEGRNGVGKTTLLRLILGDLQPSEGAIALTGRLGVLRQAVAPPPGASVADLMGLAWPLDRLARIERGEGSEADLADADWDLPARLRRPWSTWPVSTWAARPRPSAAARSPGSCWPAWWPTRPMCCCSTSRPTTSTPRRGAWSRGCCAAGAAGRWWPGHDWPRCARWTVSPNSPASATPRSTAAATTSTPSAGGRAGGGGARPRHRHGRARRRPGRPPGPGRARAAGQTRRRRP